MIPEPNLVDATVTCRTPDCMNREVALDVLVNADAPAVLCGVCGGWIVEPS